jgi:hypothetical protein
MCVRIMVPSCSLWNAMNHPLETDSPTPGHPTALDALLWDLFTRLMNVPGDRVEAEIFDASGAVTEFRRGPGIDVHGLDIDCIPTIAREAGIPWKKCGP